MSLKGGGMCVCVCVLHCVLFCNVLFNMSKENFDVNLHPTHPEFCERMWAHTCTFLHIKPEK